MAAKFKVGDKVLLGSSAGTVQTVVRDKPLLLATSEEEAFKLRKAPDVFKYWVEFGDETRKVLEEDLEAPGE